ncbi:ureidoglycolate hydrolase-like isoform X1 [Capsicum annuum]|uniref:ureidoglycolate hydrolase-like isoform X1 n=1 Tax=Capsicum annuum TaxID=4072 RepID=UPI001FB10FD6|nr:ureidoglycolate hydrolase-like isoform X1 [Capsicum annuum]
MTSINYVAEVGFQASEVIGSDYVHLRRALFPRGLGSAIWEGIVQLAEQLISTKDSHNVSFSDADKSAGYANAKGDLSEFFLKKGTYSAFVKLHIEQGLILEKGISIGVVTAIAAPASIKVTFEGNGGHAGAALMPKRNDAGLPASELALAVEKHVLNSGSVDTVGTVGSYLPHNRRYWSRVNYLVL